MGKSMIDTSKGDTIVDYRNGDEAVVQGIKDALKGQKLEYAYDAVSEKGSIKNIASVLIPRRARARLCFRHRAAGRASSLNSGRRSRAQRMWVPFTVHSRTLVSSTADTSRVVWRKAFSGARSKKSSQAVSAACRRASRT